MAGTRPDPLHRRVGDAAYVVAAFVADFIWSAVEDGARLVRTRLQAKRHRLFSVTRRP